MRLNVRYLDGSTFDATLTPGDFVRFERHFGTSVAKVADQERLEHMYFLAHAAAKRTGNTALEFDEWIDTVALDSGGGDDAPLPPPPPSA